MKFRRVTLKMKLLIFVIVLLIFANIGLGIPSYFVAKNELEDKGKIILENGVDMAIFIIEEHNEMVKSGVMTEAEAKDQVKGFLVGSLLDDGTRDLVTPIDLGENGYFYAVDDEGIEVMHPSLEGQYVLDELSIGEDNKYIVRDQLVIGKTGGFYEYNWYYPHEKRVGTKVSYSKYEPNWGWTVVASAYTSDFNKAANKIMLVMAFLFTMTLLAVVIFANRYMRRLIKPILDIIRSMESFEENGIKKIGDVSQSYEVTELVNGYNHMVEVIDFQKVEVRNREKQLEELAYIDVLTKLPNINMMEEDVNHELEKGAINGFLILIDIRDLKVINSIYGNHYGDEVISWVAESLQKNKLTQMMLSRVAGNEFGIWYIEDNEEMLLQWVKDIQEILSDGYANRRIGLRSSFSVAYVEIVECTEAFSKILQKASAAMQYAKKNGINVVKYNEEIYKDLENTDTIKRCAEIGLRKNDRLCFEGLCKAG